jgi:type II secretory pathway pseudopilin PulG
MWSPGARSDERGFTVAFLLLLILAVAAAAAAWRIPAAHEWQREKEAELYFRGQAYRRALRSYYLAVSPHRYPTHLEDLLLDPRFQHRRHIRALYAEPFTEAGTWVLLPAAGGGIQGVATPFQGQPLQTKNLPLEFKSIDTSNYKNMLFLANP